MAKNKNKCVVVLLLILWNMGLSVGCSQSSGIEDNGSQVIINPGQFHGVFEKGVGYSNNYVVFAVSVTPKSYSDGVLFLMPLAKAEELASQYGDFMRCRNAGSNEGKQSTKNFVVIAADTQVKNKINKIGKIINSSESTCKRCYPVIKINVVELKLLKVTLTMNGQEMSIEQDMGARQHFLVKDIEILSVNYKLPGN